MQDCGECKMCCELIEVHDDYGEILSNIDSACKHLDCRGCSIYKDRPSACRIYQCMWSQMDNVGDKLRPDKCGILFDRQSEDVISARIKDDTNLSVLASNQIRAFNKQGFSVLVFRGKDSKCYPKEGHSEEHVRSVVYGRSHVSTRSN